MKYSNHIPDALVLLERELVEFIRTLYFAMRTKNYKKNMSFFTSTKESNNEDFSSNLNLALCLLIRNQVNNNISEISKNAVIAYHALDKSIELNKSHWLARFLRGELIYKTPTGIFSESVNIIGKKIELVLPGEDINKLIEFQNMNVVKMSYFICPSIVLAREYINDNKMDKAIATCQDALERYPVERCRYDIPFLVHPFKEFLTQLKKNELNRHYSIFKDAFHTIFPDQCSLRS